MKPVCLARTLQISWLISFTSLIGNINPAFAQNNIVPDNTLGEESSVVNVRDETSDSIDGGATRGSNLFHSFQEFNVGEGRGVYFSNPDEINNIFSRVTGSNASNILGTLGVDGAANLYLINPNGIIFGANSSLDVNGSFTATTAHGVRFGEQGTFDAINPETPQLLTINPSAYFFNQLENQNINGIQSQGILQVPEGNNLTLLGGDIELSGTTAITPDGNTESRSSVLFASGGLIELGSLNDRGEVEINELGNLTFSDDLTRGNISLSNTFLFVPSNGSGFININAQNLELSESSFIFAGINSNVNVPDPTAGDITINLTGELSIDNSTIANAILGEEVQGNAGNVFITADYLIINNQSRVDILTNGLNTPGNLSIKTTSLEINNGSIVSSRNIFQGNGGSIIIDASDYISLDGESLSVSERETFISTSNIVSNFSGQEGKAGDISIRTGSLNINNGTFISSISFGDNGNAGNITINATESIIIDGEASNGVSSSILNSVDENIEGNSGNINLNTKSLSLLNGSRISSSNNGLGNIGNITISATDFILIKGEDTSGRISQISGSSFIGLDGDAGDIEIKTNYLELLNGGSITSGTGGKGKGGDITINANEAILIDGEATIELSIDDIDDSDEIQILFPDLEAKNIKLNSQITSSSIIDSEGQAGDLKITTKSLEIFNGGEISANTLGKGNGGNITIDANESITLSGKSSQNIESNISSSVIEEEAQGDGGEILLTTNSFQLLNGGEVSTSTSGQGKGGNITIKADFLQLQSNKDNNIFDTLITSLSQSNFTAGNITLDIASSLTLTNSAISSQAEQSTGGNLTITAETIELRGDSLIRSDIGEGFGDGGDIFLQADSIIAFDDSNIFASAKEGTGGNIILNTPAFFGESFTLNSLKETNLSNLRNNNRVDINATGRVSGFVSIPDVSFIQNSLTEISNNAIDTDKLVANSCVVPNRQQKGTFIITGKDGLATTPDDESITPYSTGEVQTIESDNNSNWQPGDPIVEPQGLYRLSNGKLILSRECSLNNLIK